MSTGALLSMHTHVLAGSVDCKVTNCLAGYNTSPQAKALAQGTQITSFQHHQREAGTLHTEGHPVMSMHLHCLGQGVVKAWSSLKRTIRRQVRQAAYLSIDMVNHPALRLRVTA